MRKRKQNSTAGVPVFDRSGRRVVIPFGVIRRSSGEIPTPIGDRVRGHVEACQQAAEYRKSKGIRD